MNRAFVVLVTLGVGVLAVGTVVLGQEATTDTAVSAAPSTSAASGEFSGDLEKSSYALGYSFGNGLRSRKVELAAEELIEGLRDALAGGGGRMTDQEALVITRQVHNAVSRRLMAERNELIAANRAAGEAFMAQNKDRPGVVNRPSGLQYEILVDGDGPRPAVDDMVKVHYRATTVDGAVVDSSYDRGEATVLRPDRVVPAWTEALPMMPVGSTWRLFTPSDLGYGDDRGGTNIPPGATLIFDVELLSIEPRPAATDAAEQE